MKESIFNNYLFYEDGFAIYNSLSKKIAFIKSSTISNISNDDLFRSNDVEWLINNSFYSDTYNRMQKIIKEREETINSKDMVITIFVTNDCNFFCKYCYEKKNNEFMSGATFESIVGAIKSSIDKYESIHIKWYGGEPLLRKNEIIHFSSELIKIALNAKIKYSATICTNGYFLDLNTFQELLKKRIINYQITLAGLPNIHNKLIVKRDGGETFNRIINNLMEIKHSIRHKNFRIIIRTNVTKSLLDVFDDYLALLYNYFSDDDRFLFVFRPVKNHLSGDSRIPESEIVSNDIIYDKLIKSKIKLNYL